MKLGEFAQGQITGKLWKQDLELKDIWGLNA